MAEILKRCVWQYLALLNFPYVAATLQIVEWKTTFASENNSNSKYLQTVNSSERSF